MNTQPEGVAARVFGVIHGAVTQSQKRFFGLSVVRKDRDANARGRQQRHRLGLGCSSASDFLAFQRVVAGFRRAKARKLISTHTRGSVRYRAHRYACHCFEHDHLFRARGCR